MTGARIVFITGTDTGVGKTVLTGLLLSHLRRSGTPAIALKPFCSGGREDAELLYKLQNLDRAAAFSRGVTDSMSLPLLTLDEINPFHFREPLAPLLAARLRRRIIPIRQTFSHILRIANAFFDLAHHSSNRTSATPTLLVEGAGGLLSPLGESGSGARSKSRIYTALDLIAKLNQRAGDTRNFDFEVIIAAANRLGVINHSLLTVEQLRITGVKRVKIALVNVAPPKSSTPDNPRNFPLLSELLAPIPIVQIPYLGRGASDPNYLRKSARNLDQTLKELA